MKQHMIRIDNDIFKELQLMKINGSFKSVSEVIKKIVKVTDKNKIIK